MWRMNERIIVLYTHTYEETLAQSRVIVRAQPGLHL